MKISIVTDKVNFESQTVAFLPDDEKELEKGTWNTILMFMLIPADPEIKSKDIIAEANLGGIKNFVETGTYEGDTVSRVMGSFENIYSIELGKDLAEKCRERFKDYEKVKILQGDSATELPKIVESLNGPAVFWLDAHVSTDTAMGKEATPIKEELKCILRSEFKHVIMIDDARDFVRGNQNYPGFEQICQAMKKLEEDGQLETEIELKNDIIKITQK
jgi:hypothetical protein